MFESAVSDDEFVCVAADYGDPVWVKSDQFDWEGIGYITGLSPEGGCLFVRLELPADHPSMAEAVSETGMTADEVEIVDVVPIGQAETLDYPRQPIRVWTRSITDKERAERARRRGIKTPRLAELDGALRTQVKR